MSTESSPTPKPRRRWLQYSLRTLLVVMIPVACIAAWLGAEYRKIKRQKEAIAWVEELGGTLQYDDEATANDWRRRVLGDWYPGSVKSVGLMVSPSLSDNPPVSIPEYFYLDLDTDAALPVASLPVEFLQVQFNDLAPLAHLQSLKWVDVSNSQVSDLTPLALKQAIVSWFFTPAGDSRVGAPPIVRPRERRLMSSSCVSFHICVLSSVQA